MNEDAKALWQHQSSEGHEMDVERVHALVQEVRRRAQLSRWLLVVAASVGVCLTTYLASSAPSAFLRFGEALLAVGFVGFLVLEWRRMSAPPLDTAEVCMEFLRQRLAQRRVATRGGWIWQVAPLLPGLGISLVALGVAAGGRWVELAPIGVLVLVWIAAMLVVQSREAAKVDAEIARLDQLRLG